VQSAGVRAAEGCAEIDPLWAERIAGSLVTRVYNVPRWDASSGRSVAELAVSLFGVRLVEGRLVDYAEADPHEARNMFIQNALVNEDWSADHRFLRTNRERLTRIGDLADRRISRKPRPYGFPASWYEDVDPVFAFYDERVPDHVTSARDFERWWADARRVDPHLLDVDESTLPRPDQPSG